MKILVTAADGFIGSHIVHSLAARGDQVRALVRNAPAGSSVAGGPNIELMQGDLLELRSVVDAAAGCEAIIHTAEVEGPLPQSRWRVWETQLLATTNILSAAHHAGVTRFVYTGSILALDSDDPPPTRSPYIQALRVLHAKADKSAKAGLPIVFVYPTYCLGPGVGELRASPPKPVVAFLRGRMPFYPTGRINVVDVRDAAGAHLLALERACPGGRLVAGGPDIAARDLLIGLRRAAGGWSPALPVPRSALPRGGWLAQGLPGFPLTHPEAAGLANSALYRDSLKAAAQLGFNSRPLEETVRDTGAWLRENHVIG